MKFVMVVSTVIVVTTFTTGTGRAQGAAQSITTSRVDVVQLASGYRASKVVGAAVYNEDNEKIGTIDDLIVNPKDSATYVVLSVGGFLGIGTHLVAVPFSNLQIANKQMLLRGGTKDSLKLLPKFKYGATGWPYNRVTVDRPDLASRRRQEPVRHGSRQHASQRYSCALSSAGSAFIPLMQPTKLAASRSCALFAPQPRKLPSGISLHVRQG